ncbi:Uma2 family endonuclease [Gloeobacter violaceus]
MGVNLAQLLEQIRSTAQQSPEPPSSLPRTLSSSASRVRPLIEELSNPIFRFVEPVAAIVAARFSAALYRWVEPRRLGHVLNSPSLRLVLNEDDYLTLTPNVAFIGHGQLDQHPFQDVIPELAAVVLCGPEPSAKQTRLEILMEYGVKVGLLLDPQLQTVSVYCGEDDRQILQGQDTLRLHELFPGWEVPISEFWPPLAETQSES